MGVRSAGLVNAQNLLAQMQAGFGEISLSPNALTYWSWFTMSSTISRDRARESIFSVRRPAALKLAALLCLLIQTSAAVGKAQDYVLHRIAVQPTARLNGMNDVGMVIGYHGSSDGTEGSPRRGFVYDHAGILGSEHTVHSLDEWIETPPSSTGSSCVGINNNFQVVGYFSDSTGQRVGYFLDLVTGQWGLLPVPSWSAYSYGLRINDSGDVLVASQNTVSQPTVFQADVFNISTGSAVFVRSLGSVSNLQDLNNVGQVTGELMDGSRVMIDADGTVTQLPFVFGGRLNNLGVVAGTYTVPGPKNRVDYRAGRFFDGVLEPIANFGTQSQDINDDGDVVATLSSGSSSALFTDQLGWTLVNDAVVGAASTAEWQFWTSSNTKAKTVQTISNRIGTGGWMAGGATNTSTTGKGKNAVTTTETRYYLMVPASGG